MLVVMQMFLMAEICSALQDMIIVRFNRLYGLLILTVVTYYLQCVYVCLVIDMCSYVKEKFKQFIRG